VSGVDEDFPAGAVHVPVMRFAQKHTILDTAFAIINPVERVMRLAHSRWPITARKRTSAISSDKRPANS